METITFTNPTFIVLISLLVLLVLSMASMVYALLKNAAVMRQLQEAIEQGEDASSNAEQFSSDKAEKLFEKGENKALNDYCKRFIKEMPNSVHANWYYALSHYNQGEYELAREYFENVIRINPLWRDGAVVYLQEIAEKIGLPNSQTLH